MAASLNAPRSTLQPRLLLRARLVLPLSRPPIPEGAVLVSGRRIAEVGSWRDLSARGIKETIDLGNAMLMPGLVNAHCHLDYTNMAGQFPPPRVFSDWLKLITATKAGWNRADYFESWVKGAGMLARTGTTTVVDMEAVPELLPEVWSATPLRVFSFLELIGIRGQRQPKHIVQEAVERLGALKPGRGGLGLCPHAPYSTVPELMRLSARAVQRRRWRLATHVAESALEYEMLARGRGGMFDWLQRSGREMSDCRLGSPVQHLARCGVLSERLLAAHANYLGKGDAALLARREVHVAHCPRCHFYFGHNRLPLRQLLRAGVNVCLGTDSLASVYKPRRQLIELNLFEEMRALACHAPWLSARKIVRMATVNGARALGMQGRIGELSPGALADLIAIPSAGRAAHAYSAVLHHTGDVTASMIDGQWVIEP